MRPGYIAYLARSRDRRPLRFGRRNDPAIEAAYSTHWVSSELSAANSALSERQSAAPYLVVISALREWAYTACAESGDLLIMERPGPLCLGCADLDHLVFLAAGDAALTRPAKKASGFTLTPRRSGQVGRSAAGRALIPKPSPRGGRLRAPRRHARRPTVDVGRRPGRGPPAGQRRGRGAF